jgi:hypothetical protein
MTGLIILAAIAAIFTVLGLAAMRWGTDSREWTLYSRPSPLFYAK